MVLYILDYRCSSCAAASFSVSRSAVLSVYLLFSRGLRADVRNKVLTKFKLSTRTSVSNTDIPLQLRAVAVNVFDPAAVGPPDDCT